MIVDTNAEPDLVAEAEGLESAITQILTHIRANKGRKNRTDERSVSFGLAAGSEALLGFLEDGRVAMRFKARRHGLGGANSLVVGNGRLLIHAGEEACLVIQLARAINTEHRELRSTGGVESAA